MQFLKRFLDFYIFSNIHVALGAFCFVKVSLLTQGVYSSDTAYFVFFSTIISYNFIRFTNISTTKNWVTNWYFQYKTLLILVLVLSGIGSLFFFLKLNWNAIFVLIPFVLLTFFYGVKLPGFSKSFRKIAGLKIFLIALCYAGITVLVPLIQNEIEISLFGWMLFLQRFIFVLLITLPFDIRDVGFDSVSLMTIPQYFGIRNTKIIGVVMGVLVLLLEQLFHFQNFVIVLFVTGLSVVLLLRSSKKQSNYYSSFWVEAIPILWMLLLKVDLIFGA
ncbi:MAG: hypothetical protein KAH07_05895 [Flavobacteriaceae bacterium]|nr:hypothetical protein [Flavobacteriaceae bacterium]